MGNVTTVQNLLMNVLVLLAFVPSLSSVQTTTKNVICYVPYWSFTDRGAAILYKVSDIDASLCTHLVYSYTTYDTVNLTIFAGDNDSPVWKEFANLRLTNPSLKVLLSLRQYQNLLQTISQDDEQTFLNNVIEFLRRWDFDGIDHQWVQENKPTVVNLLEKMHAAFAAEATPRGKDPLILMISVRGGFGNDLDVPSITQSIDIIHVLTTRYDDLYWGETKLSTPMYGGAKKYGDVSHSVSSILDAGVPPEKLHMTIQFYAVTFTLSDPELTSVGAPVIDFGKPGKYLGKYGELAYYEVYKRLQEEGYTAEFDPEGQVNFAYKGDQWMTYEDLASLEIKMSYVYEQNLGGVAVQYLHHDDYTGQFCNQGQYPLLTFIYNYNRPGCPDGQDFDFSKGYCVETACRIITFSKNEL